MLWNGRSFKLNAFGLPNAKQSPKSSKVEQDHSYYLVRLGL